MRIDQAAWKLTTLESVKLLLSSTCLSPSPPSISIPQPGYLVACPRHMLDGEVLRAQLCARGCTSGRRCRRRRLACLLGCPLPEESPIPRTVVWRPIFGHHGRVVVIIRSVIRLVAPDLPRAVSMANLDEAIVLELATINGDIQCDFEMSGNWSSP